MRAIAYVVAVVAAAGIIWSLTRAPQEEVGSRSAPGFSVSEGTPVSPASGQSQVTLHVPGMHCPFGCYPSVKETLTKQPGVVAVELAKQSNADTIDNPHVTVTYAGDFNADAAIKALADAGFDKSSVE